MAVIESKKNSLSTPHPFNWIQGKNSVPNEVSCKIVSYLNHVDAWNFSQTCKHAHDITSSDITYENYLKHIGYIPEFIDESKELLLDIIKRIRFLYQKKWIKTNARTPYQYLDDTESTTILSIACPWKNDWKAFKGISSEHLPLGKKYQSESQAAELYLEYFPKHENRSLDKQTFIEFTKEFGIDTLFGHENHSFLHMAAKAGRDDIVRLLIDQGANIDILDSHKKTPLNYAVIYENVSTAALLLESNADLNIESSSRQTPIFYATAKNHIPMLKLLIKHRVNLNEPNSEGLLPLEQAINHRRFKALKFLVNNGANIDTVNKRSNTLLHRAVEGPFSKTNQNEGLKIIRYLINKGVDVNSINSIQTTSLHAALNFKLFDSAELLISLGANVTFKNYESITPLHIACRSVSMLVVTLVETLIKKGADVNAKCRKGITPIFNAVNSKNLSVVNLLLQNNAQIQGLNLLELTINNQNPDMLFLLIQNNIDLNEQTASGDTALIYAIKTIAKEIDQEKLFSMIDFLIKKGADINKANHEGKTALICAIEKKQCPIKIPNLLIKKGADVNAISREGTTPLLAAIERGDAALVKYLLKKGAVINMVTASGITPWVQATKIDTQSIRFHIFNYELPDLSQLPNQQIINLLLKYIGDINKKNCDGYSSLIIALLYGHSYVLSLLIKAGANVNEVTHEEKTPLMYAVEKNNDVAVKFLLKAGANINYKNSNDESAFTVSIAASKEHSDKFMLNLVIDSGAEFETLIEQKNPSLLHAVQSLPIDTFCFLVEKYLNKYPSNSETAVSFLTNSVNIDERDEKNRTLLHHAIVNRYRLAAKLLIDMNVEVNTSCIEGRPPLMYAVAMNELKLVQELIHSKADVNIRSNNGNTALTYALKYSENPKIIKLLIQNDAQVDIATKAGETPLMFAAENCSVDIVKLVLTDDINKKSDKGWTALNYASMFHREEIIDFLKDLGGQVNEDAVDYSTYDFSWDPD